MSKRILISFLLVLGCTYASAQDYDKLVERNLWYASANATGIRQDNVSASKAELFGSYTGGGFHADGDASSLFSAGASAYGIKHEKNFSMKGAFSFLQQNGKDMYGSMLLNADRYPVNVIEFTPGDKKLQTYAFEGDICVDLGENWRIGSGMVFKSSNYAKFKDLRYVDYALDMRLSPSLMYHDGDLAVGADLILSKNSESLTAEQIGSTVSAYEAFLDKGLWYGVNQLWSGGGVHLKDNGVSGFPINEMGYGAGLQASYGNGFIGTELVFTNGKAGEKQNIWYRFPGRKLSIDAGWKSRLQDGLLIAKASATIQKQSNNETILEKVSEGGVTTTIEHGSNLIMQRRISTLNLSITYMTDRYEARAKVGARNRNVLTSISFPYLCHRNTSKMDMDLGATAYLGRLSIIADLFISRGWYNESARMASDETGAAGAPFRLDEWNRRALDYELSQKVCPSLTIRYEVIKGLKVSVDAAAIHAIGLELIESPLRYNAGLGLIYEL